MPNQPKTPLIAVRVPVGLQGRLRAIAKAEGKSLSDVVREALEAYVKRF